MNGSRFFQSCIGVTVGLIVFTASVSTLGFFLLNGLSRNPSKPNFPAVVQDPSPTAKPSSTVSIALVTYQGGLVLREKPQASAKPLATLDLDETVMVIEKSEDGQWQHLRSERRNLDGWVTKGNVQTVQ